MERYAEIDGGVVKNVTVADPNNLPDHLSAWVLCGNAGVGWTYDGSTFSPPVPPTQAELDAELAAIRDDVIAQIDQNEDAFKALAKAVFMLASAQFTPDPSLTPAQFKTWLRNQMD